MRNILRFGRRCLVPHARFVAVSLLGLCLSGQQPSREYIRLGGRVIAIENPPDVLTPSSAVFQAAGGTGQIQVVKTGSWTGHSNAGWIHFTSPAPDQSGNIAGSGTLTVNYSVDPNVTGAQLDGTLTIAGASFSVTENGGSQVLSVDQPQMTVPGTSGSATFHVTSTSGASWLVQSFPSWIHISDTTVLPPSSPLTTSRDVTFLFDPNPLGSTIDRSGAICLVSGCSGPAVQVTQTGGLTFSPISPASVSSSAQSPTVGVTAPTGTNWTATVNQGDQGWLSVISGISGSGNGTVTYHVTSNVGGYREGTLLIGGNSYTVGQAGGAAGTLSISPSSWIFTVAGSQQFTASLNGSQTTATWGFSGYNYGTINTSSGLYTAPGSCSNSGGICTDTITASKTGASTAYANVWTSYGSSGNGSALLWSPTQNYGTNWDVFTLWVKDWFILPLQIMPVEVLITPNTSPQPWPNTSNSCFMTWDMANSQQAFPTLHPAVSGETDQFGTFQYGGTKFPPVIANSLCELDLSRTTWRRLGNDMLIDMRLLFRPAFAGNKGIYLRIPATGYNPYPNGIAAAQYAAWTSPGYSSPNVNITSPSANASVSGTTQLTGWALDNISGPQTPINKVEVFVDGAKVGDAQRNQAVPNGVTNYCSQYPDQTGISPGWDCPNFGWTYPWNTTAASNGDHLIRIVVTDSDPTPGVTFVERHFTVSNLPSVAAPTFNPGGGTYPVTQSVVIQSATAGATIVFTTDGSTPTSSHGTVYASPVTVANSMTVKAFAYKSGMTDSSVAQAAYTIGSGPAWYNSSWSNRKAITIDHTKVSGSSALSNFPIVFSVTDANLKTVANGGGVGKVDGTDLLFTASDGVTKLDHELERYVAATGETVAWIRIPSLSATTDTVIYVYYGNTAATDQQNKPGVWDGNYKGAYHFPDGTSLTTNDSTSNGNNGTNHSGTAASAKIGGGVSLNGSAYVNASVNGTAYTQATAEAWVKPSSTPGGQVGIFQWGYTGELTDWYPFMLWAQASNGQLLIYVNGGYSLSSTLSNSIWTHLAVTWTSTNLFTLYVNGVVAGTYQAGSGTPLYLSRALMASFGTGYNGYFTGMADEGRISNVARSAPWIATEYNNQNSPSTFVLIGGQESGGGSQVATPAFSPATGTYSSAQSVVISTATSGASIRYTTDGSNPTSSTGTIYSGPATVSSSLTLKAIAYKSGMTDSAVASADYTISSGGGTVAAPTFSPPGGTYSSTQSVTISSTTSGASIRYTTDGSTPSSSAGTLYSGPVSISSNLTLKAIAYKSGMTDSAVASANYALQVAPPSFNPASGAFSSAQSVTISTATAGASLRYTIDGTTPTSSNGTLYSGPVTVSNSLMLKAIAYKAGMADSPVAAASYTIGSSSSDLLLENLTFGSGTVSYQATNSITADNFIVSSSAAVTLSAGNYITLQNGFHATAGSAGVTFHAFIGP
jgi:hypothetical protein